MVPVQGKAGRVFGTGEPKGGKRSDEDIWRSLNHRFDLAGYGISRREEDFCGSRSQIARINVAAHRRLWRDRQPVIARSDVGSDRPVKEDYDGCGFTEDLDDF